MPHAVDDSEGQSGRERDMNLKFVVYSICLILPLFFYFFVLSHLLQVVCAKFLSVIWLICQLWEAATEQDQTCNCNEPLMLAFSAKNI